MPPEPTPRPFADEGEVVTTFHEIRATLTRIEKQTTLTNGRVRALEIRYAFVSGAIALLTLVVGAGVGWIGVFR